jgi:hypothetical protein
MLFGVPPLIILMAFAVDHGMNLLMEQKSVLGKMAIPLLVLVSVWQVAWLYRVHPYQYVSFNILAGSKGNIPNLYETEYWFTSSRHMLEALPEIIPPSEDPDPSKWIPVRIAGPLQAGQPFVPKGFRLVTTFGEAAYYLANTTMRTDSFAEGQIVYSIERDGIPIGVIKRLNSTQQP